MCSGSVIEVMQKQLSHFHPRLCIASKLIAIWRKCVEWAHLHRPCEKIREDKVVDGKIGTNESGEVIYRALPAWKHTVVLAINFIGFFGAVLIFYGILVIYTGLTYPLFERYADPISRLSTLIGTIFTALSVYFGTNKRPPDPFSKKVSAFLVILAALLTVYLMLFSTVAVPPQVISGFALLAIAGGLFRTFSR